MGLQPLRENKNDDPCRNSTPRVGGLLRVAGRGEPYVQRGGPAALRKTLSAGGGSGRWSLGNPMLHQGETGRKTADPPGDPGREPAGPPGDTVSPACRRSPLRTEQDSRTRGPGQTPRGGRATAARTGLGDGQPGGRLLRHPKNLRDPPKPPCLRSGVKEF